MSEKQQPYLYVVRASPSDSATGSASPTDDAQADEATDEATDEGNGVSVAEAPDVQRDVQPASPLVAGDGSADASEDAPSAGDVPLNGPLQQAIMYAAVSWVALCAERVAHSVDIQPVARRLYEVSVHYVSLVSNRRSDEGIILRVRLEVEPGLVLRTVVEPVRP